ncbi:type VI secretion system membrane subunit TssM [Ancylobacter sp. 6x-1]|uniref:Type VI secretion system membrane subunit TssM n=1 Tax=Ancylobacter crimeensis TaxID=2579147 RepID=A0ABT0D7J6_9HYPH|nr:type VI secretion system membrane subunit TssM [Ancylobacter crimeensis]MCK0195918.1 type VI secretion system membrane subunit TssM [Ancylobacter crimeensis]
MSQNMWLTVAAIAAGALALAGVVWFVAPLIAVAGFAPFDEEWIRLLTIALIGLGGFAYIGYEIHSRLRSTRNIAEAVAEPVDDGDVLRDRMKDALATLKASGGGHGDFLYDLPWYLIIGPPGSGKTTALVNCGLSFPLAKGRSPQAIAGVGGTRYCDWWFTEDAVLVDTAGRYTTQDSNEKADKKSWFAFLDLLKKNRARQPINGVIVAINIADIVELSEAERLAHASAIRARLQELHERLKIDFPIYVILTKFDLIAGFSEFFINLNELQRRMVWGTTFRPEKKNDNQVGRVGEEFDALVERLTEFVPDRLQQENDPTARLRIFGFPAQVATLKQPVVDFVNQIFEPTRYHANATLRGFYFTSGTQQGTPIDRIIGSLSKSFGAEALGEGFLSGTGKSYFLNDLIRKVIIGEAAWVSTDRAAVRRNVLWKSAGYGLLFAVVAGGVAAWTTSYTRNDRLVGATGEGVSNYKTTAAPALAETQIADRQYEKILPVLEELARLPTGYAERDQGVPLSEGFGLAQRPRLASSTQSAYRSGLERYLRPRMLFRLEEVIEQANADTTRSDNSGIYDAFKVYLMLGRRGPVEKGMIVDWMRQDWTNRLYPGPERAGMREALEGHLTAMLDLDTGAEPMVPLNDTLMRQVQQSLVRMNVAERAYQILRSRAHSDRIKPWSPARSGSDMATVFTSTDNGGLDAIEVPGFYTYDGFQYGLIDGLPDIAGQLERDRWVLGDAGQQSIVTSQFDTLADDILKLYAKDFIAAWSAALGRLQIKPLTADKPRYLALAAISAAASPLKQIFEQIKEKTDLSRERKPAPAGQPASNVATGSPPPANPARPPVVFSSDNAAGRSIETYFRPFYAMLQGDGANRPVDQVVGILNDIFQGLIGTATESGPTTQINAATRDSIRSLRASSARFPAPFDRLLRNAADELDGNVATSVIADLQKSLAANVTQACRQAITGRYPFDKSDKDVALGDFARVFSPGGLMDRFYTQELKSYIDTSREVWTPLKDSRIGAMLAPASVREFQRASQIKDVFFGAGGTQPNLNLSFLALTPSIPGTTVKLEVNGVQVTSAKVAEPPPAAGGLFAPPPPPAAKPQPATPTLVQWPGLLGRERVALFAVADSTGDIFPLMEKPGTWALFRVADQYGVQRQGSAYILTIPVSGRDYRYQYNTTSTVNPLTMPALREFNCPSTLQ